MTSAPPPSPPPPPAPWYPEARRPLDGLSLGAFVCSLTCCAAPVAVGLGIAGLVRTSKGRRRGRWAALTGLIIGSVLSLAMLAGAIAVGVSVINDLDLAEARAGECVDLDFLDTPNATSCDAPHDGEIMWVGRMTPQLMREWDETEYYDDFCLAQDVDEAYKSAYALPGYDMDYYTDAWGLNPGRGDWLICYLTSTHGQLGAPIAR